MVGTMTGCSDDTYGLEGEGTVKLQAKISSDVKVVSRADVTEEYAHNCNIWISSTKGLVRKYSSIDEVPADGIRLLSGSYVAEAWAGDSVPASFDAKYFKGYQPFEVTNGSNDVIELNCKVANVVASVNYEASVDDVLKDYTLTVSHTRGSLTFEGRDERRGYFMMPNDVHDLSYTLTGTKLDGSSYTRSGVIADVKPTTEYAITVKCATDDSELGGGYLTIEIDERELLVEDEITISTAPSIVGYQFDLKQPVYAEEGGIGRRSVWVLGSNNLKSVILESAVFNDGTHLSLGGNDVDLINATADKLDAVKAAGINVAYPWEGTDRKMMKISLENSFTSTLRNGEYTFKFIATDETDRTATATLTFVVSDAKVAPLPVETSGIDFSARTATLRSSVVKDGVETVGFEYRAKGSGSWIAVDAQPVSRSLAMGTEFTAYITGLEPGTIYEYRPVADGAPAMATMEFTTEPATQLPNAGFEEWQTSTPYLLYASGGSMFWDSGNHGSKTMGKNVTVPDGSVKHSGNYSVKLASQFVGIGIAGKFAAGNCFIGEYLKTDGTDGVLGWGRAFTGRPVALKGYVKYSPVAISHINGKNVPAEYVKGEMDRGIIYIALLDDHTETAEGKSYPVIVKTKTQELFDKNSEHVIAYGELVLNATDGDGMIEFTIPLKYNRTDIRPSYILCTASASKGGDYFAGGSGSNMWLDDLELVY